MEKKLNETILRITGSASIEPNKLTVKDLGRDIEIKLSGTIVKVSKKEKFDGTYDRLVNIRFLELIEANLKR